MILLSRFTVDDAAGAELPRLREHLLRHAGRYFSDFEGKTLSVALQGSRCRAACSLYHFELRNGGPERRGVVVKRRVPRGSRHPLAAQRTHISDIYRLSPEPGYHEKDELEHATLCAIERHFGALGDPRFGVVRVLDRLPDLRAIFLEKAPDPVLSQLFRDESLMHRSRFPGTLSTPFENAGAWLRVFQGIPLDAPREVLRPNSEALAASFERLTGFLAEFYAGDPFFADAAALAARRARAVLPHQLPLGLGHGDFSPANIFVGPGGRVAVFDTCGKWRVPVYEDLAFFLFTFKTLWPQVWSLGTAYDRAALARYESAFLRGYFGVEPVPMDAIRIFELQCVLAKWASRVLMYNGSRGLVRAGKGLRMRILGCFFRRYAEAILHSLRGVEA